MFETIVIGGGPAGTGALVQAARAGTLRAWLDRGVAIVEAEERLGGSIGSYALNADTLGGTFLECLEGGDPDSPLARLREHPVSRALAGYRNGLPPLPLVGRHLNNIGECLARQIARHPRSRFFGGTRAHALRLMPDGSVRVDVVLQNGRRQTLRAASAVLALGGRQIEAWDAFQLAPGLKLDRWRVKLLPSNTLLAQNGAAIARRVFRRSGRPPRAIIIGGAHSAFSAAWMLLERLAGPEFPPGGLHILHRAKPRVFYATPDDAAADDYAYDVPDVCPATGRINRLGGLRGDGREVWRRIHGVAGQRADCRAAIMPLGEVPPSELRKLLDAADLIVPACGYRISGLPIMAADGSRLAPATNGPCVDADSRVRLSDGAALSYVFAVGLGSGFRPWGAMSGEPSFHGQQNSLWLYQNGLGEMIQNVTRGWAEGRQAPVPTQQRQWAGWFAQARYRMPVLR